MEQCGAEILQVPGHLSSRQSRGGSIIVIKPAALCRPVYGLRSLQPVHQMLVGLGMQL